MVTQAMLPRRPFREGRGGTRAAALALCLVASAARAGNISITMTTTAEARDGGLSVHLTVSNTGDEAASSVVPILRFGDREARGKRQESLAPSQSFDDTLTMPEVALGPGRWPFRVAVDYTDQNQYPFQALHVAIITVGNPSPAKITVQEIRIPPLSSSTVAHVQVKSLAGVVRKATVNVFAPEGLEATDGHAEIDLAPWEEKDVPAQCTQPVLFGLPPGSMGEQYRPTIDFSRVFPPTFGRATLVRDFGFLTAPPNVVMPLKNGSTSPRFE